MKKGFTLIELLAVMVVLIIIALIIFPVVLNIIKKARIGAEKDSVKGIYNAIELYLVNNELTDDLLDKVGYKGQKPNSIEYSISYDQRSIFLKAIFGKNCYIKLDDEVKHYENLDDCLLPVYTTNLIKNFNINKENSEKVTDPNDDTRYYKDAVITNINDKFIFQGKDPSNYLVFGKACFRIVNYNKNEIEIIYDGNKDALTTNPCMHQYNGSVGLISSWGNIGESIFGTNNDWSNSNIKTMFDGLINDDTINSDNNIVIGDTNTGTINLSKTEKDFLNKGTFSINDLSEEEVGINSTIDEIKALENELTYDNYIGLLSISEYLRGSSSSNCTYLGETEECKSLNYLNKVYGSWTMNKIINNNINDNGVHHYPYVGYFYSAQTTFKIRPVLYLKGDTLLYGQGTYLNPYRLTKSLLN